MCKRFIAIPLLCLVVLMAACPFSVYADSFPYPENTVYGSVNISFEAFSALSSVSSVGAETVSFGSLWTGRFNNTSSTSDGYGVSLDIKFVLNLQVGGDLYIAYPYYIDGGMDFTYYIPDLDEYRYPALDYNVDFGADWPVNIYTPNTDTSTFDKTFGKSSLYVKFIAYRNVPSGIYSGVITSNVNDDTLCFGVYASHSNQMNAIVDEYLEDITNTIDHNGISVVSLTDILQDLWEYRQSLPDDTVDLSILYELEYQSSVEYLMSQVDSEYVKFLAYSSLMTSNMLVDLANGLVDYNEFIFTLGQISSNASNFCSTVDQYTALNGVLQNTLAMAEQIERIKAKQNLDQAISDGDVEQIQQYYDAEQELISAFDQAKFQAQLDFDTWFTLLPPTETIEYKKIFDYILNDSPIKNYIMIPVSMGLVTILLGTGIRFVGSKRGDDHD